MFLIATVYLFVIIFLKPKK